MLECLMIFFSFLGIGKFRSCHSHQQNVEHQLSNARIPSWEEPRLLNLLNATLLEDLTYMEELEEIIQGGNMILQNMMVKSKGQGYHDVWGQPLLSINSGTLFTSCFVYSSVKMRLLTLPITPTPSSSSTLLYMCSWKKPLANRKLEKVCSFIANLF